MAIYREITTKDDVPLSQLLLEGVTELELFNQAPRVIRDMLAQSVSEQTFRVYVGDMEWEELAEGEHARTGGMDSTEMAFNITKYGRSLGFSQEFIEDNPSDMVRRQFSKLAEGALKKEHAVLLDVVRNGWANGSNLWFTPEDFGAYTFTDSHDHVFADTQELFERDGGTDTNAHTPSEHLRELSEELEHHGKTPEIALVGSDFAGALKNELTWSASYHIPTFEGLRTERFPENGLVVDGVRVYKSAYLNPNEVHIIAASERPLYFHERRPVQLTNGSSGGPVGEPGALIGAYGSARYGAAIADPLAGVMVTADNLA
jgi:hypothetical protein